MFAVWCPGHGATVLLSFGDIVSLRNGGEGIEVGFRCPCGHEGVWHPGVAP